MGQLTVNEILRNCRNVAVVGLSREPTRASYNVAKYLLEHEYTIIPINPSADEILGQKAYKTLLHMPQEVKKTIDVVNIFRPSESVPPIVDQAITLKRTYGRPHVVWMQLGIRNNRAAEKAQKEGLTVIMDKCMMQEHGRLSEEDPEIQKLRAKKMRDMTEKLSQGHTSSKPFNVTDSSFEESIKKHPLILVDCWADWCGPCRMIAPIIEELAQEYAGKIAFAKLNVDENPGTAAKFNIMGIPTLLIMKNGSEVDRIVGVAPKASLENRLKKHI
ncbi:MAG: thioredoxin [Candidatus Bathyarchaeota archaeon]|nr:MAG: thioredoxin [Candidatus Bathyarchaeota archaeon]